MHSPFWRRIEVAITSLTRNQVVGQPARGFESHRLRQQVEPAHNYTLTNVSAFFHFLYTTMISDK